MEAHHETKKPDQNLEPNVLPMTNASSDNSKEIIDFEKIENEAVKKEVDELLATHPQLVREKIVASASELKEWRATNRNTLKALQDLAKSQTQLANSQKQRNIIDIATRVLVAIALIVLYFKVQNILSIFWGKI